MPEVVSYTYRAELTKDAQLRFISHLDYAALVERAICRAKLPVVYSEGFNPHMKLSFASALALGVTSESEYMEFILSKDLCQPEVFDKLSSQLPDGVRLKALKKIEGKHKALMALADEARYRISFSAANPLSEWETAVSAFNNAESCFFQRKTPKKTRDIEIKQYMIGQLEIEANDGLIELSASVKITQQGSVKPAEILEYLRKSSGNEYDISNVEIRRTALLCGGRNLMDVM